MSGLLTVLLGSCNINHAPRTCRSYLAERQLQFWGDGDISAVALAKTCRAAQRDGLNIEVLNKLAKIGTETFENCKRDLDTTLQNAGARSHTTPTGGDMFSHCILPSEIVKLLTKSESKFAQHLCPNENACAEFWRGFLSSSSGQEYAAVHLHLKNKSVLDLANSIPTRLHEDAGPFSKAKSVDVLCWSSLLGNGSERECKYHPIAKNTAIPARTSVAFFSFCWGTYKCIVELHITYCKTQLILINLMF